MWFFIFGESQYKARSTSFLPYEYKNFTQSDDNYMDFQIFTRSNVYSQERGFSPYAFSVKSYSLFNKKYHLMAFLKDEEITFH